MRNRSSISWITLLLGLSIGLAVGLVYAWQIDPLGEYHTEPWQLNQEAQVQYMTAISLAFRADSDLMLAVERLLALRLDGDAFQVLADTACDLFRQGINTNSERADVEALVALYQPQGRTSCADQSALFVINPITPSPPPTEIPTTPTLEPPASKTPTITSPLDITPPTAAPVNTPTGVPSPDDFAIMQIPTFCSVEQAGTIEVYVELPGAGSLPGVEILVTWDSGEDHFFTGLKPERGDGYADFQMEANRTYFVEVAERSPRTNGLTATPCTTEDGQRSTTSYRVIFRRLE